MSIRRGAASAVDNCYISPLRRRPRLAVKWRPSGGARCAGSTCSFLDFSPGAALCSSPCMTALPPGRAGTNRGRRERPFASAQGAGHGPAFYTTESILNVGRAYSARMIDFARLPVCDAFPTFPPVRRLDSRCARVGRRVEVVDERATTISVFLPFKNGGLVEITPFVVGQENPITSDRVPRLCPTRADSLPLRPPNKGRAHGLRPEPSPRPRACRPQRGRQWRRWCACRCGPGP